MATHNWPGFGLASVSCSLDRPATVNRSSYTGVRSVATNPWHGKWSFKVQLATMQGDGAFQAARAFFTSLKGQVDNFHLPAVEAPQNANTGVTVSSSAASGAVTLALTGLTTALLVGNMATVNGQLLSITGITTLSGSAQTITFEPPLRAAAPSTTAVETAKPYALVALSTSDFAWDIGQWRRYGLSFDCDEAIGDTDGASPAGDVWNATFTSGGGVVSSNDNIIVKQNGTALGSLFNTLNFTGAVSVTSSGGGAEADVAISASGETIYLKDYGVVADGVTVNSAAALNTLLAGLTRGAEIVFPYGTSNICKFDGEIEFSKPFIFDAYGGSSRSGVDGGTILQFPAGSSGLVALANGGAGAQRSVVRNLTIDAASRLTTSATASYTAGSTTITITGGTNDYAAKQVIRLRKAGPSYVWPGKTATIPSGSNVATIASADGANPGVYVDQALTIPGAGAAGGNLNGYVGAWGPSSITVVDASGANLNAGTTVSTGTAYTVYYPLVARILSVVGSTVTIDQVPTNTSSVTGEKLQHCDCGFYGEVTLDTEHVEVTSNLWVGLILNGQTTGSRIADNGNHYSSNFAAYWAGVIARGADAQANAFFGCNFAGPQISFLDMSLIGNPLFGGHFAFNVGMVSVLPSSYGTMSQVYFEGGTSVGGNGITNWAFGCLNVSNGYGWNVIGATGLDATQGNFPPVITKTLTVIGGTGAQGGARITGPAKFDDPLYAMSIGNVLGSYPSGVAGIRLNLGSDGSNRFYMEFWDFGAGAYAQGRITCSSLQIAPAGSVVGTWDTTGLNLATGKVLKINGTQVLNGRDTGWTAWTGTGSKATKAVSTATTADCAAAIKSIIDALMTNGILGA